MRIYMFVRVRHAEECHAQECNGDVMRGVTLRNLEYHTCTPRTVEARGRGGRYRIEVEEDGAEASAMMVEEDCVGFSTIEVRDFGRMLGLIGLVDLEVPEYHMPQPV